MAKKITKPQPWTKDDVRTLKTMAREKVKTTEIARKLKLDRLEFRRRNNTNPVRAFEFELGARG